MRIGMLFVCVVLAVTVSMGTALGSIPHKINYQGQLTDTSTGDPLTGSVDLTFRIFDSSSDGTELWSEAQMATADDNGVVSVVLGASNPIDIAFDGPVWLQVEVDSEVLLPRREIVSVPFAYRAEYAENADSLGGTAAGSYSVEGHDHDGRYYTESELSDAGTINDPGNPVDWTKIKGVPSGFSDGTDDVGGSGDGHSLDAMDGDPVNVVYVDAEGEVGIGTAMPERLVHIYGGPAGGAPYTSGAEVVVENDGNTRIQMVNPNDKIGGIEFGDTENSGAGYLLYTHALDKLRLGVNGSDRMVVDSDGDVGIGTTTPGTRLHIQENSNSQTSLKIENTNTGASSAERLSFDNEDGSLAYIAIYDDDHSTYGSAMVMANNRPSGHLQFRTGGVERLGISNSGVTTITSPGGSPLDCQTSGAGYMMIETDDNSPTGLRMENTNRTWYLLHSPSGGDRISIYDGDGTGTAERLTVEGGTGHVGIHKTNPVVELDVSGRVKATDNEAPPNYVGDFRNEHSDGSGVIGVGNDEIGWYVSTGAGVGGMGYNTGGYFRANNTSTNGGQRAIYCGIGTGDYARVCYRSITGTQYLISGTGVTAAAMPTTKGYKTLVTPQSPEAWIEDYGSAEIKGGTCHVDLDPLLLDCVTIDEVSPMKVFVQLTSPMANQFYVKKGAAGFDVIVTGEGAETVDATFDYRVVAARKDHQKIRFAEAQSPEEMKSELRMIE